MAVLRRVALARVQRVSAAALEHAAAIAAAGGATPDALRLVLKQVQQTAIIVCLGGGPQGAMQYLIQHPLFRKIPWDVVPFGRDYTTNF